jgi:hypothetical protein
LVEAADVVPRARLAVSFRELAVGLGLLGIGVFITMSWLRNPDGHTVRRLATGLLSLLVGIAVTYLSVRRVCSACGYPLRTFSFRTTGGKTGDATGGKIGDTTGGKIGDTTGGKTGELAAGIEQALVNGDAVGAGRLLNEALATSPGAGGMSCSLSYCDGCRGLLSVDMTDGAGAHRPHIVTGARAMSVIPTIEQLARLQRGGP